MMNFPPVGPVGRPQGQGPPKKQSPKTNYTATPEQFEQNFNAILQDRHFSHELSSLVDGAPAEALKFDTTELQENQIKEKIIAIFKNIPEVLESIGKGLSTINPALKAINRTQSLEALESFYSQPTESAEPIKMVQVGGLDNVEPSLAVITSLIDFTSHALIAFGKGMKSEKDVLKERQSALKKTIPNESKKAKKTRQLELRIVEEQIRTLDKHQADMQKEVIRRGLLAGLAGIRTAAQIAKQTGADIPTAIADVGIQYSHIISSSVAISSLITMYATITQLVQTLERKREIEKEIKLIESQIQDLSLSEKKDPLKKDLLEIRLKHLQNEVSNLNFTITRQSINILGSGGGLIISLKTILQAVATGTIFKTIGGALAVGSALTSLISLMALAISIVVALVMEATGQARPITLMAKKWDEKLFKNLLTDLRQTYEDVITNEKKLEEILESLEKENILELNKERMEKITEIEEIYKKNMLEFSILKLEKEKELSEMAKPKITRTKGDMFHQKKIKEIKSSLRKIDSKIKESAKEIVRLQIEKQKLIEIELSTQKIREEIEKLKKKIEATREVKWKPVMESMHKNLELGNSVDEYLKILFKGSKPPVSADDVKQNLTPTEKEITLGSASYDLSKLKFENEWEIIDFLNKIGEFRS